MANSNRKPSFFSSILWSIIPVALVAFILFLIDRSSANLNVRESENVMTNLLNLFPDQFFSQTFAPYNLPLFNMILALLLFVMLIVIVVQFITRIGPNR